MRIFTMAFMSIYYGSKPPAVDESYLVYHADMSLLWYESKCSLLKALISSQPTIREI